MRSPLCLLTLLLLTPALSAKSYFGYMVEYKPPEGKKLGSIVVKHDQLWTRADGTERRLVSTRTFLVAGHLSEGKLKGGLRQDKANFFKHTCKDLKKGLLVTFEYEEGADKKPVIYAMRVTDPAKMKGKK